MLSSISYHVKKLHMSPKSTFSTSKKCKKSLFQSLKREKAKVNITWLLLKLFNFSLPSGPDVQAAPMCFPISSSLSTKHSIFSLKFINVKFLNKKNLHQLWKLVQKTINDTTYFSGNSLKAIVSFKFWRGSHEFEDSSKSSHWAI